MSFTKHSSVYVQDYNSHDFVMQKASQLRINVVEVKNVLASFRLNSCNIMFLYRSILWLDKLKCIILYSLSSLPRQVSVFACIEKLQYFRA